MKTNKQLSPACLETVVFFVAEKVTLNCNVHCIESCLLTRDLREWFWYCFCEECHNNINLLLRIKVRHCFFLILLWLLTLFSESILAGQIYFDNISFEINSNFYIWLYKYVFIRKLFIKKQVLEALKIPEIFACYYFCCVLFAWNPKNSYGLC